MNSCCLAFQRLWILGLLLAQPAFGASGVVWQTSVAPQADEDLAAACRYELTLTDPSRTVKGVWVIFDRGRDMLRYYGDPEVQAFAQQRDWALLFPFHCAAKSYSDVDVDPARGIGRALFAALTQLAEASHHSELASSKLILTGSADAVSGTQRPYAYFRKYFDQGAPWTFVVQNHTPHCCIINAKGLVLRWLDAVVTQGLTRTTGWYGFIKTAPSQIADCPAPQPPAVPVWCRGTKDSWGGDNWSVSEATINRRSDPLLEMRPAGWLPTRAFANQWRSFVRLPEHPITSLP